MASPVNLIKYFRTFQNVFSSKRQLMGEEGLKVKKENRRPTTLISNDAKLWALIFCQRSKACLDPVIQAKEAGPERSFTVWTAHFTLN